jgi:hypothetical protein
VPAVEKEKKALAKGEALGFSNREAADPGREKGSAVCRRQKTTTRSLHVQDPASVLDRFVTYTNQVGVDVYWQALEKLLTEKGK